MRLLGRLFLASSLMAVAATSGLPPTQAAGPAVSGAATLAAPGRAAEEGVLIAAVGDIACDPTDTNFADGDGRNGKCKQKLTARLVRQRDPTAVLILGDAQYDDGRLSQFRRSYDLSWGRLKGITYPAVGNHEYYTPRADGYFDYYNRRAGDRGEGYYSFEVGTWHLVALNSNCFLVRCGQGSRQYRWLRADLRSSGAACTVAYMHHPRFSTGPHDDSIEVTPLWRLMYREGVDIVLAGHDHAYERYVPLAPDGTVDRGAGIREFVVGTGGATTYDFRSRDPHVQARNDQVYGVLFLALRDGGYRWSFDRAFGERFSDAGVDACH